MNIRIKKIIIAAVALFFVSSGVAFAHGSNHRPPGNAYGHYKVKKHHYGWHKKHYKPQRHHGRYVYKEFHHYDHEYGKHERRWRDRHYKPRSDHRDRDYRRYRRYPGRDGGPKLIFKIILKDKIF